MSSCYLNITLLPHEDDLQATTYDTSESFLVSKCHVILQKVSEVDGT